MQINSRFIAITSIETAVSISRKKLIHCVNVSECKQMFEKMIIGHVLLFTCYIHIRDNTENSTVKIRAFSQDSVMCRQKEFTAILIKFLNYFDKKTRVCQEFEYSRQSIH